jgi:hypothetical protein
MDCLETQCLPFAECVSVVRPQEQYIFIHDAILEACLCGETAIPACEYKAAHYDMIRIDSQSNSSHLKDEFQVLEAFHIYWGIKFCLTPQAFMSRTTIKNGNKDREIDHGYIPNDTLFPIESTTRVLVKSSTL